MYCEGNNNMACTSHCFGNNDRSCWTYCVGTGNIKCTSHCTASGPLAAVGEFSSESPAPRPPNPLAAARATSGEPRAANDIPTEAPLH
jgi:hypothetical protein